MIIIVNAHQPQIPGINFVKCVLKNEHVERDVWLAPWEANVGTDIELREENGDKSVWRIHLVYHYAQQQ